MGVTGMLNDKQKELIEAEERFRYELKKNLEAESSSIKEEVESAKQSIEAEGRKFSSKLFEFLNSSVGSWFLSSVIVTGGAGLYQQVEHHYETQKLQHEQLIKYKFEIENRIDHMELALRQSKTVGDAKEAFQRLHKGKFPLSPELQNRGLGSMYLNLYDLLSGSNQSRAQEALNFIRQLEDAEEMLDAQSDNQPLSAEDKAQFTKLIKAIKELHFQRPS
jgi:hypothetical protein